MKSPIKSEHVRWFLPRLVIILVVVAHLPLIATPVGAVETSTPVQVAPALLQIVPTVAAMQPSTGMPPTIEQEAPGPTLATFIIGTIVITIVVVIVVILLRRSK